MQWYHVASAEVSATSTRSLPTCHAWNHVVLAPLFFVPNYLMPTLPSSSAFTWSVGTYWRAHRRLRLAPHQARASADAPPLAPALTTSPAQVPTTGWLMLEWMLEHAPRVHLVGFDGYLCGRALHYYDEKKLQLQVNAAGALLHDWGKEQAGIERLIIEGRVVLL